MDDINLDVLFNGNTIQLKNLSTKLGKGTFSAEGSYALQTDMDIAYNLHLKADKAQIASQLFTGTITSDLTIAPEKYRDMRKAKEIRRRRRNIGHKLRAVSAWMMCL